MLLGFATCSHGIYGRYLWLVGCGWWWCGVVLIGGGWWWLGVVVVGGGCKKR